MINLKDMGSFHIGGREIFKDNLPIESKKLTPGAKSVTINPNGYHQVEQMYVQYFIPADEKGKYPLVFLHGGGLSGVTFESTPDERAGWINFFLRRGWAIYNTDAVGRGRSGWNKYSDTFKNDPLFLPKHDPFERFRIGDGIGSYDNTSDNMQVLPGNQFPIKNYNQFMKQIVPRWIQNDEESFKAYDELIKKVKTSVLIAHSQGGLYALKAAKSNSDLIKGIILVEPTVSIDISTPESFSNIPILLVYGDYIDPNNRWYEHKMNTLNSLMELKKYTKVDIIDLPDQGIYGNSHLPMMDRNSDEVAEVIQEWLVNNHLYSD